MTSLGGSTAEQGPASGLVALSGGQTSLVIDTTTPSPTILHWGSSIGSNLMGLRAALEYPIPNGGLDVVAPISVTPEHGSGYLGRPGIEGHRLNGEGWAPRFVPQLATEADGGVICTSIDANEQLTLHTEFTIDPSDVVRMRSTLTNNGPTSYSLQALRLTVPLPARASEALTFSGRWTNEFLPQREVLKVGSLSVENRSGRTSHDRVPLAFVGTPGFTETQGEVWGVHLEWSGNSSVVIDTAPDGRRSVQLQELLLSGEVILEPGESYDTPWISCVYSSQGINAASNQFHRELRANAAHPSTPRPVTLNIWEAVYFDHDLSTLLELANCAARIGVERFVIDDGWFHGRRDDHAGLGDWWVDTSVWPDGLWPLANHVVGLGMELGLWFEPEMVNPDSDLYREHPDWALVDARYEPTLGRHQLVLNVARDDTRAYLFGKIDAILSEYPIAYVKWDMNRPIIHGSDHGRAAVHAQTLGLYRLLDDLRAAHPNVEFESCASGGGRMDFGILRRTSRVWTSDCNDALDRQRIQRGLSYFVPPEYMGAHIGGPVSHTTRRRHSLGLRAGSAFFGHLGIEWNVLQATAEEQSALTQVIALHKRFRPLLHGGTALRLDHVEASVTAHAVVAGDRREALVSYALVATAPSLIVTPLQIVGLADDLLYRVELLHLVDLPRGTATRQPGWLGGGLTVSGQVLRTVGLQPPVLDPESLIVLHLVAISEQLI